MSLTDELRLLFYEHDVFDEEYYEPRRQITLHEGDEFQVSDATGQVIVSLNAEVISEGQLTLVMHVWSDHHSSKGDN